MRANLCGAPSPAISTHPPRRNVGEPANNAIHTPHFFLIAGLSLSGVRTPLLRLLPRLTFVRN
jgi:hypothetical protein